MKFVRLSSFIVNVEEIQYIQKMDSYCTVVLKDGTELRTKKIEDEEFENAIAYIRCGGVGNAKTNEG